MFDFSCTSNKISLFVLTLPLVTSAVKLRSKRFVSDIYDENLGAVQLSNSEAAIVDQLNKELKQTSVQENILNVAFLKGMIQKIEGCRKDRPASLYPDYSCLPANAENPIEARAGGNRSKGKLKSLGIGCNDDNCSVPLSLSGIWNYGCWCNFGNSLLQGTGPTLNKHDVICQKMQYCLRCAKHDGDAIDEPCNPKEHKFNAAFAFGNGDQSLVGECERSNKNDNCGTHLCMCEMTLIADLIDLIWTSYVYEPEYKHKSIGGSFDYEETCVNHQKKPKNNEGNGDTNKPKNDPTSEVDPPPQSIELTDRVIIGPPESNLNSKNPNYMRPNDQPYARPNNILTIAGSPVQSESVNLVPDNKEPKPETLLIQKALKEVPSDTKTCCGSYPRRYPFRETKLKKCCNYDQRLYNYLSHQCCDGGGVMGIGELC